MKTRKRYLSACTISEWDSPDVTVGQFLFQKKTGKQAFLYLSAKFCSEFGVFDVCLTANVRPFLAIIGFEVPKFCGVTEMLVKKLSKNVHVHIPKLRLSNITSNNYGKQFCVNIEPPIEG